MFCFLIPTIIYIWINPKLENRSAFPIVLLNQIICVIILYIASRSLSLTLKRSKRPMDTHIQNRETMVLASQTALVLNSTLIIIRNNQECLDPVLQGLFNCPQPFCRQIIRWMLLKAEANHLSQLFLLSWSDKFSDNVIERHPIGRRPGLRIFIQAFHVIRHCIIEQGQPVVKERCKRIRPIRLIIHHQAEVSEMTVLIADQCIKHQHIRKTVIIILTQGLQVFGYSPQRTIVQEPVDRYKGMVNITEQLTGGAYALFP